MIDFVTILRTAIDKQGDSSPDVRARIYEKALEALGRLAGTHSPLAIEDYRVALKEAVGEIERSFGDPTKTTFETLSPSFSLSEDAFHIRPRIRPASIFPPPAAPRPEAAPPAASPKSNGADRSGPSLSVVNATPKSGEIALPSNRVPLTQVYPSSYTLEVSAFSKCSICHKWALCIDPTHCWNRDQVD